MDNLWDGIERRKTTSDLLLVLEKRLTNQDQILYDLHDMIKNHINDEKDLTPIVKKLVKTWEAAYWLVNVVNWIGIIAGSIAAFIALFKGSKL